MRRFISFLLALALIGLPSVARAEAPVVANSPVVLVGSFGVGATISALYPTDDQALTASFEWYADGSKLASISTSTLALGADLVGKLVTAKVTLSKNGFADLVLDLTGARVFGSLPANGGTMTYLDESVSQPGCFSPRPSGVSTPTVGWQLWFSCQPHNTTFGTPVEQKFSWYRNGQQIAGATQSSYRLQAADAGQSIWGAYQTTYSNGFVFSESKKLRTSIPFQLTIAKATINGLVTAGASLVSNTAGSDPLATFTYQWFSDYAPILGATSASYTVQSGDVGKAVQVSAIAQRDGYSPTSRLSDPATGTTVQPVNPKAAYSLVFNAYQSTNTAYDIGYIVSPTVTAGSLTREKALVQKAADFWRNEYTPAGVTVVYLTKDDATWAEEIVAQHPSWSNSISGGIRSWIERNSCGFALAFKADQKQIFIQCVRNGGESSINDQQVGPHEYSHWVQYEQTSALYLGTVPWLVEGQANFYGLALGVASEDSTLSFINRSIAGHSTQFDIYNGYQFADFKMLEIFETGNIFDVQTMLTRGGTVWDQYAVGTLVSEWLVSKYGHQKYVDWMKELLRTKGQNNETERAANVVAFRAVYGFEFSQLGMSVTPFFAARSQQLRNSWAQSNQSTSNPTSPGQENGGTGTNATPTPSATPTATPTPKQTAKPIQPLVILGKVTLPAFSAKNAVLTRAQRAAISQKLKSLKSRQVVCTALYSSKTTAKDMATYTARAQNTCAYAKTTLTGLRRSASILVTTAKISKTTDLGKVILTLKG